jgi:Zn-dependent metalloprotease
MRTMMVSERIRGNREILGAIHPSLITLAVGQKQRTIYDAQNGVNLPGVFVEGEENDPGGSIKDQAVKEAFDYSGKTYDFYQAVFHRNSLDGRGMRLDSTVHYDLRLDNAFWNGRQMVYGDGDGKYFQRFTKSIDVIGHELTHGVTQFTAQLSYQDQPGALNEHVSDVFGSMVKQYYLKQAASEADWLIGEGVFTDEVNGKALRSMKSPGTAYDDPLIGKDLQPAHMKDYVNTTDDNGGIHLNSGIPNRAFYLATLDIGGYSWEKAGKIWYVTLTERLQYDSDFKSAAESTIDVAGKLYGLDSKEQQSVQKAWTVVGVI